MSNFDADALIRAGRAIKEPFQLSVERVNGPISIVDLTVRKVLRLLPGKRIVAVAEAEGRSLLIKIFVGRAAKRYMRREVAGVHAIEDSGVLTPSLEWQARLKSKGGYVLAFEFLEEARNLSDVFEQSANEAEQTRLIGKLIPVLASLHEGGVIQNDIHPENFLFHNDRIYTIDGGDVSRHWIHPVGETRSLNNLALFFAQFHSRHDHMIPELLEQYRQVRSLTDHPGRAKRLVYLINRKRNQRKEDYLSKAFRECTQFAAAKTFNRFWVCNRTRYSESIAGLIADPDAVIASGKILKDGNTATVALVESTAGPLVIKRYNIKGPAHRLSRMFRKSRAWISWANAHRLEFLGISTVKPVALIEERFGPLRGRAYFISEYVEGPDATVLQERDDPSTEMVSIVELLKSLSAAGVTHGDLKASNFLLAHDGAVIIDLDSMREHQDPEEKRKAEMKDLERFLKNWESSPQMAERFSDLLG